jgi:hypothetical protein
MFVPRTVDPELFNDERTVLGAAARPSPRLGVYAGAALFSLLVVVSFALGQSGPSKAKPATHVAPRTMRLEAAAAMDTQPVRLAAAKAPTSKVSSAEVEVVDELDGERVVTPSMLPLHPSPPSAAAATASLAAPASGPVTGAAPSSPAAAPAPATSAAPARNAATGVSTGFLRLPASVAGVLVDGTPRRVAGGALQVTCGWHKIKTPQHPARPVNVPCGGTTML